MIGLPAPTRRPAGKNLVKVLDKVFFKNLGGARRGWSVDAAMWRRWVRTLGSLRPASAHPAPVSGGFGS